MDIRQKIIITVLFVGIGVTSFFIGRISAPQSGVPSSGSNDIVIISASEISEGKGDGTQEKEAIQIRASSRGSKYYFPWCPSTFSEENTIFFASEEEAEKAGYELAQNCLSKEVESTED